MEWRKIGCRSVIAAASWILSAEVPASAQDIRLPDVFLEVDQSYGLVSSVKIDLIDQVQDKCWTNTSALKSRIKLKFEQNEVKIRSEGDTMDSAFSPKVFITGLGYRAGGSSGICVGSIRVEIGYAGSDTYGGAEGIKMYSVPAFLERYQADAIMTNGQNLNSQFDDFVDGAVSEFLARVLSARHDSVIQEARSTLPYLSEKND